MNNKRYKQRKKELREQEDEQGRVKRKKPLKLNCILINII